MITQVGVALLALFNIFPVGLPQQVKLIVQNALRLYSQDRTGLVDYALESGGKEDVLRLVC